MSAMEVDEGAASAPPAEQPSLKKQKLEATLAARPWVEKYRPSCLDELVAHKDIIGVLRRLIAADKLPHTLLYGPPGTGKTSTILAAARDMYGAEFKAMTLELNASDDRGIDVVRNQIKSFAGTRRLFSQGGIKLIILDEADQMTNDAQFALRRVIEKYTANARFCLICNYANKIIPALQSRCTKFRFAPLEPDQVRGRVQHIVDAESVPIEPRALDALLELGQGDMRRVLNILQSASVAYPENVTYDALFLVTGNPLPEHVDAIFDSLLNEPFSACRKTVNTLCVERGYALVDVIARLTPKVLDAKLPAKFKAHVLAKIADVEYRCAFATKEGLQLSSLVAAFVAARSLDGVAPAN